MNLGIFDSLVRWSELTGCSLDEALAFMAFVWMIFYVVLIWAFSFLFGLGRVLYRGTNGLFRSIRCKLHCREKPEP